MGMPAPLRPYYTVDEVLAFPPDGHRYELVYGAIWVLGAGQRTVGDWREVRDVPLVVEVLSPSTAHHDRFRKRLVYREQGVATYWIVDLDARLFEVWTPDASLPVVARETVRWHPAGASEPFTIAIEALLA